MCNITFRKWGGGEVKGHLELFRPLRTFVIGMFPQIYALFCCDTCLCTFILGMFAQIQRTFWLSLDLREAILFHFSCFFIKFIKGGRGVIPIYKNLCCEFCIFWRALATWNWHRKGLLRHIKNGFFSLFTMKKNLFWISRNHSQWKKSPKSFNFHAKARQDGVNGSTFWKVQC